VSWHGWLTNRKWFTNISGHPSATGLAQDRKSSPAKADVLPYKPLYNTNSLQFSRRCKRGFRRSECW